MAVKSVIEGVHVVQMGFANAFLMEGDDGLTPGHCAGHVALVWHPGRMLFAGDVCMNIRGLGDPLGFESLEEGRASQRKLASLLLDAAGFGHGEPIARDASTRFRNKYGKHTGEVHPTAGSF